MLQVWISLKMLRVTATRSNKMWYATDQSLQDSLYCCHFFCTSPQACHTIDQLLKEMYCFETWLHQITNVSSSCNQVAKKVAAVMECSTCHYSYYVTWWTKSLFFVQYATFIQFPMFCPTSPPVKKTFWEKSFLSCLSQMLHT